MQFLFLCRSALVGAYVQQYHVGVYFRFSILGVATFHTDINFQPSRLDTAAGVGAGCKTQR